MIVEGCVFEQKDFHGQTLGVDSTITARGEGPATPVCVSAQSRFDSEDLIGADTGKLLPNAVGPDDLDVGACRPAQAEVQARVVCREIAGPGLKLPDLEDSAG